MSEGEEQPEVDVEKGEVSDGQMAEIRTGDFYTIKQVALKLGFTVAHITKLCQIERIRAIKPAGSRWRIPKSEYERLTTEKVPPLPYKKKQPEVLEIDVPAKEETETKKAEKGGASPLDIFAIFGGSK